MTDTKNNENVKNSEESTVPSHFIRSIIADDIETNKYDGKVVTRFPPMATSMTSCTI